jgi:hypothetical protein
MGLAPFLLAFTGLASVLLAPAASAAEPDSSGGSEADFLPAQDIPSPDGLSGDDLYQRVLDNRFDAYDQEFEVVSGDGAGHFSRVELNLRYMNFRERSKRVLSKTIAKYFGPPDVRHLGYLVINKAKGPDDQFVYRPSSRKVRRVNVRGESLAGTDFSFEDVVPPEFEDGRHFRLADAQVGEIETYVVTVIPHPETESQYSKIVISLEKEHFVPLQTLYWDNKRVLIKQLDADPNSLESFEAPSPESAQQDEEGEAEGPAPKVVWIARRARMTQLRSNHFSSLDIQRFEANPGLRDRDFSQRELTSSR